MKSILIGIGINSFLLFVSLAYCEKSEVPSTPDLSFWYKNILKETEASNFDYDCTGKEDGNYPHPSKCTHYVACVAQTYAYPMPCQMMEDGVTQKHYVKDSGPDPATSYCAIPWVAGCDENAKPPNDCTPSNCNLVGYCQKYSQCVAEYPEYPDIGQWKDYTCGDDLYWNPTSPGTCAYFLNLEPEVQDEYKNDWDCIEPCGFYQKPEDACSPRYTFKQEFTGTSEGRDKEMQCPIAPDSKHEPLCWSQSKLSCDGCSSVIGPDGTPCASPPPPPAPL